MAADVLRRLPRYIVAGGVVLVAYGLRLLLEPWLHGTHPFGAFYPAVFLIAYLLGRWPAVFASLLSAALGSWAFLGPQFAWGAGLDAMAPLVFFAVTVSAGVWLIGVLTSALEAVGFERERLRAVADAHAELFKDLQSQIGHHMQLVAGVLALRSAGGPDAQMAEILKAVGDRSRLIARAHRAFMERPDEDIDVIPFAGALARAVCEETQAGPGCVEIAEGDVRVPFEMATSLGVALVECLQLVLNRDPPGRLQIVFVRRAEDVCVSITHAGGQGLAHLSGASGLQLFCAMLAHLGAVVTQRVEGGRLTGCDVMLPLKPPQDGARPLIVAAAVPGGATLH